MLAAAGLARLGRLAYLRGDSWQARSHLTQSLEAVRASRLKAQYLAEGVEWLAAVEGADGRATRAARLFGAADTWWLACGAVRYGPDQEAYERDVADVRAQLSDAAFAIAWADGRAITFDEIVDYALEGASLDEVHRPV